MYFPMQIKAIKMWLFIMYFKGSHVNIFRLLCISVPQDCFYLNSVDPDIMPQYAAFHQGLHCLSKYSFRGLPYTKG